MTSKIINVIPQELTAANFAAFGDVISVSESAEHFAINDGHTMRYHNLADVDVAEQAGKTLLNIFRSTPLAFPLPVKMMERHPLGSQAFIPMGNHPYVVVVAPKGELDTAAIKVFLARSDQGVNYHKGTWHHFCLALNEVSDFLVVDRGGEGDNCDVEKLDGSLVITLAE
ncbi:ureidoglycolate hydrolase [Colwellia sp. MT41]|uniref:Ureidoglycolate lyase n=1 Tax=Colwellia marinimaniae TaxID=1513592 RepID=A0ABQ0MXT8_9GAMM|nr:MULTISPECIES: ureidoglycolate lyase [Colwellia]ALO36342.1 ureidoglycolate hydrolase [Colwellia sp. MT41]GAW97175.1 ureidoglycolate lyase [Colwellia marinimaniae]